MSALVELEMDRLGEAAHGDIGVVEEHVCGHGNSEKGQAREDEEESTNICALGGFRCGISNWLKGGFLEGIVRICLLCESQVADGGNTFAATSRPTSSSLSELSDIAK